MQESLLEEHTYANFCIKADVCNKGAILGSDAKESSFNTSFILGFVLVRMSLKSEFTL